jgi:hypothetical protein
MNVFITPKDLDRLRRIVLWVDASDEDRALLRAAVDALQLQWVQAQEKEWQAMRSDQRAAQGG